ncbi:RNA-binding (RRM/RBD/RNP motif) family protein [Forsythia ovata]|uniref:RNA-binding (RRM/RBD/RNP motif) family protein n=1 Tax=Forsythia ovata TaxID=205694 RepID=A0ABD1TTI2_9LAMI
MDSSSEEYAAFREKVKRTIYVDNMSPLVTEVVVKASFNQFGNVTNVQFIPTYLEPKTMPRAALVEMENSNQARIIIAEMENYPLMISGMPRPVRARAAEMEMFDDRPRKPGRRIQCRWLEPKDPDFEVAKKIKQVVKRHAAEASFLLEQQLAEEAKLGNQQAETLKANYRKYRLIDGLNEDGTVRKLAQFYKMPVSDA